MIDLRQSYFKCDSLEETEKLLLILLAHGCRWQSGHKTIKPGASELFPDQNIISITSLFALIFDHKTFISKYRQIDTKEFIEKY